MSRIQISHLSKSRFGKPVLSDISLTLQDGQTVALTGENGSGKTTLLDLIAGHLPLDPEEGSIHLAGGSTLGYVRQRFEQSVADAFFDETVFLLEQRLRRLEAAMAAGKHDKATLSSYDEALAEVEASDAYAMRHRLEAAFRAFGLDESVWERSLKTLSGGERMRIELATCLIREPDILLLDEPTNHLDLAGITFLEAWLKQYKGCCLFVSHDRAFMDAVATDVARLSGQAIEMVPGNYTHYKEVSAARLDALGTRIRQQEKALAHERSVTQTMLSHRKISQYHHRKRRADKIENALTQLKSAAKNRDKRLGLHLAATADEGDPDRIVLAVRDLTGGYDTPLFEPFSAELKAGRKVAVLGPNGCGKSTLFAILKGELEPLSGSYLYAPGIKRAGLKQHVRFDGDRRTVYEAVRDFAPGDSETGLRSRLAQYGFDETDRQKKLHVLSGGEAARVALLDLLYQKPGMLFLDEPTNHLDIYTREVLEEELAAYTGTVLLISHDRYFLNAVADEIWGFVGSEIRHFDSYEAWSGAAQQIKPKEPEPALTRPDKKRPEQRRKSAERRQAIADLENRISALHAGIEALEASLTTESEPSVYEHYAALTAELDQATDDYLRLLDET